MLAAVRVRAKELWGIPMLRAPLYTPSIMPTWIFILTLSLAMVKEMVWSGVPFGELVDNLIKQNNGPPAAEQRA